MSRSSEPNVVALLTIIVPVLNALLTADEVDDVRVVRQRSGDGAGEREIRLAVTVQGEQSCHFLWREGQAEESPDEIRDRLVSELQDFIAESRFAWGEQRPCPP
jgi:hypothetical protein